MPHNKTSIDEDILDDNNEVSIFRRRNSMQRMYKSKALECVPFSSLLYVSRPLEGGLTRRRSQFFFFIIGCWTMMMAKEEHHVFSAQHFMFSVLQTRCGQACLDKGEPLCAPQFNGSAISPAQKPLQICPPLPILAEDFLVGLLLDGQPVAAVPMRAIEPCSLLLSFPAPVQWNGWYFVTSRIAPSHLDPVRHAPPQGECTVRAPPQDDCTEDAQKAAHAQKRTHPNGGKAHKALYDGRARTPSPRRPAMTLMTCLLPLCNFDHSVPAGLQFFF